MAGERGSGGRRSSLSLKSLIGWLCLASAPAASSAWFVCGSRTVLRHKKRPVWYLALFLMNILLFCVCVCVRAPPRYQHAITPLSNPFKANASTTLLSEEHSTSILQHQEVSAEAISTKNLKLVY